MTGHRPVATTDSHTRRLTQTPYDAAGDLVVRIRSTGLAAGIALRIGRLAHQLLSRFLLSRAGFPTTTLRGFTFFIATARAPTIAPSPTVTPGPTNASAQTHASEPITIGGRSNGKSGLV